jgi:tetratricopeptide (TPR) repeat protein
MDKTRTKSFRAALLNFGLAFVVSLQGGCERAGSGAPRPAADRSQSRPVAAGFERFVLEPLGGDGALDKKIADAQAQVRTATDHFPALEKLGWLLIAKARVSFDPGFYKLAEQDALAMDSLRPASPESLLLRGYALQNLHHFKAAEPLARELVIRRGCAFDYGLLGDVLMEQGRLDEAVAAYQQMADIKPDLYAYTRAAHMRWLKGDLPGAIEAVQMAVQASSPRDAEPAAWVYTRMGQYQLQAGDWEKSRQYCVAALEYQKNYPPALLLSGRLLLAREQYSEAVEPLSLAAKLNPLPEYQWTLAEALRAAGRASEAETVERDLKSLGAATDPRTFALFLATRGEDIPTALALAKAELEARSDVFTHDALACALAASGQFGEADEQARLALAEGTQDARLFLHAGIVARELSRVSEAQKFLDRAAALKQTLLPSERAQLKMISDSISRIGANSSPTETKNQTNKERS